MSHPDSKPLNLYLSQEHDCSYLPGRPSASLFADPYAPMDTFTYSQLVQQGFRRSGNYVYAPHCPNCQACVPVRVPTRLFAPNRTQKRTLKRNQHLRVEIKPPRFEKAHYDLYERYLKSRHSGGGMDDPTPEKYMDFLTAQWSETLFVEFFDDDKLVAVAVTDQLTDGMSAVYTFFDPDPDYQKQSLGVYAILWQIQYCLEQGLPYLYLGYWIKESPKMNYKTQYRPLEFFYNSQWVRRES